MASLSLFLLASLSHNLHLENSSIRWLFGSSHAAVYPDLNAAEDSLHADLLHNPASGHQASNRRTHFWMPAETWRYKDGVVMNTGQSVVHPRHGSSVKSGQSLGAYRTESNAFETWSLGAPRM